MAGLVPAIHVLLA